MSYSQANACIKLIDLALYYRNPSLFHRGVVIWKWGRFGQRGTVRETWFAAEGEAWAAGEQWRQRKEKRGYRVVNG